MPSAVVIHGAGEPDEEAFKAVVESFKQRLQRLGDNWNLHPTWWGASSGDADSTRASLADTYSPEPWKPSVEAANPQAPAEGGEEGKLPFVPWGIWKGRQAGLDAFATVGADALRYWDQRDAIQWDIIQKIPKSYRDPAGVNVIAHSMGGVVAVDLAVSGKLPIRALVTFGTPVSVAHVLVPTRLGLRAYQHFDPPQPIKVPNVGRWTNIWNKYDPVGFWMSRVFKLEHGPVLDREVVIPGDAADPLRAHLVYWELNVVAELVSAGLARLSSA